MSAALDLDGLASAEGLHPDAPRAVGRVWRDLRHLGRFAKIKTKAGRIVPFSYDRWHQEQRRFERERTGRDVILKPRQIGFSTLELVRDFQFAHTHEGVQVLVVVHSSDAKAELFDAAHLIEKTARAWGLTPKPAENTKTGLRWPHNHSSLKIIEAGKDEVSAADRGRSGTVHRLHATEVAFYRAPGETMAALLSTVGDNECVIESTANGQGNWFYECVVDAQAGRFADFRFHFYPWHEHAAYRADPEVYSDPPLTKRAQNIERRLIRNFGIDAEQLAFWRKMVAIHKLDKALREFPPSVEAAFTTKGDGWIEPEHIEWLRDGIQKPVEFHDLTFGSRTLAPLRIFRPPEEDVPYVIGADPSEGVGGDEAGVYVLEHRTGEVAAVWDSREVKPGVFGHVLADIGTLYNTAMIGPERNAWRGGESQGGIETLHVLEKKAKYPRRRIYRHGDGKLGWRTDGQTRPMMFDDLGHEIEARVARTPDAKTIDELASIEVVGNRKEVPRKGKGRADDGLFVAWAIAWQIRQLSRIPRKRPLAEPVGPELDSVNFRT